jgi:UDP-hydrolysing UDP-N-acetyl-D-glucosamine 2-epimerase
MRKVLMFIGGRSNYGRLYQLAKALHEHPDYTVCLILACSAANVNNMPKAADIPGTVVQLVEADMYHDIPENMATSMSLIGIHVSNHLLNNNYDVAICHGDRFETLGFAVACSYANLPLVHMEAGEYSGNIDNKIRWAISSLADLQLAPTKKAYHDLIKNKLYNAHFVGSPAIEYILDNRDKFENPEQPIHPAIPYIMVVYNPTKSKEFEILVKFINKISEYIAIYWVNPNIDPGHRYIVDIMHELENDNIVFTKNLEMDAYLELLAHCVCLVGNTSSGLKEAAALKKHYILLPGRQKDRECGPNVLVARNLQELHAHFNSVQCGGYQGIPDYDGQFGTLETCGKCIEYIDILLKGVVNPEKSCSNCVACDNAKGLWYCPCDSCHGERLDNWTNIIKEGDKQ